MHWTKKLSVISAIVISIILTAHATNQMPLHPKVTLSMIKAIKTQEKSGDEIYLTVTSFFNNDKSEHTRIPDEPLNWPSRFLDRVKDVPLWEAELKEGEAVTIMFSLIEQDAQPWDTDDLIGIVRLHLKNEHGRLLSEWSGEEIEQRKRSQKFLLRDEHGSNYELKFRVE